MREFRDAYMEESEELDWFREETDGMKRSVNYDSLTDLRMELEKQPLEEEFECGDIKEDGLMWKYSEDLADAMNDTFSAVSEKLYGYEMPEQKGLLSDYVRQLEEKCEVVTSGLCRKEQEIQGNTESIARIEACLSERGCVIAMVSDDQWREYLREPEALLMDSGVRSLWVTGIKGDMVVVNDFANENGRSLCVPREEFCKMHGILMEVYK